MSVTHHENGVALAASGRLSEAAESYRRAVAIQPRVSTLNNLGGVLSNLGEIEEAIRVYRQALQLEESAVVYYNMHGPLLSTGDLDGAATALAHAVRLQPVEVHFRFYLGLLLSYAGHDAVAAQHFNLVRRDPGLYGARWDAWNYIRSAEPRPVITGTTIETFRAALTAAKRPGLVLEFGVNYGTSIRQIAGLAAQSVHGFDSFQGLPERWESANRGKGSYSTNGVIPTVPENVTLHVGWFADTLPDFLATTPEPIRFANIDCDLFSSTQTVLSALAPRIGSGTVIVFDEYIGNKHWREDEFRAWQEAVATHGWRYEYLTFSFATKQVVVRVL